MKAAYFLILASGILINAAGGLCSIRNDTRRDIVGVYICPTGSIDFMAAPVAPSQEVMDVFQAIDSLSSDEAIVVAFDFDADFDAGSAQECMPISVAAMRHAFGRGIPVFVTTMMPHGEEMIEQAFAYTAEPSQGSGYAIVGWQAWASLREKGFATRTELVEAWEDAGHSLSDNALGWIFEGYDYVILGYRPMFIAVISQMCESIESQYPEDIYGNPLGDMPMAQAHRSLRDIALVLTISNTQTACAEWITYALDPIGLKVAFGGTSVGAYVLSSDPIYSRFSGAVAGFQGAAEYEYLLAEEGLFTSPGEASQLMGEDYAVRYADWGRNCLEEGEIIPADSILAFTVEEGQNDIRLIDRSGWLWLKRAAPVDGLAELGVPGEFRLLSPTVSVDSQ